MTLQLNLPQPEPFVSAEEMRRLLQRVLCEHRQVPASTFTVNTIQFSVVLNVPVLLTVQSAQRSSEVVWKLIIIA